MLFNDVRYHDFNVIREADGIRKWSTDWNRFPGFSYIPLITELEESILPFGNELHRFMQQKWHYSLYISFVYVVVIRSLQSWMAGREKPFNLRLPMAYWSSVLALFSIIGVVRCLPEFVHILVNKGFNASFTDSSYYKDWRLNLWYLFFVLSKALELVDTLFIVLRKQKLLTLHWVHHCLTLCYSWYVFGDVPATARWMVNMNFMIHSMMYTYYACKAFRMQIPRVVNVTITTLQIIQMMYGLYINIRVALLKVKGEPCDAHISVALTGLSLYGLFFILFVNFFIRSYLLKPQTKSMVFTPERTFSDLTVCHKLMDSSSDFTSQTTILKNGLVEPNNNTKNIAEELLKKSM